ncbi:MAG TPA: tetratricopeptide repeat protein [Gemmatimonadaceae bacterium]|nr:tetratricopeptide repeat protein [Gemmatimonadaceae bacterium]
MSNIAKLKKKAAEFEQKKHYEKALELYQQVLDSSRATDEERDVPLYNRVGDLHFRVGNTDEAINYYEKAVDLYAEGGFFNNAIALCNKILRYSPNRSSAYYKLGLISAKKGFNSDAKQNFLEYADRMQKGGKLDEAFRALKEFADLCPGQDDVRLMLADQLVKADRKPEALEQLQLLYDTLEAEGRTTEAAATVERMQALDPGFTPKRTSTPRQHKKEGLVFLDLDYIDDVPAAKTVVPESNAAKPREAPVHTERGPAQLEGLELTALASKGEADSAQKPSDGPGLELVDMRPPPELLELTPLVGEHAAPSSASEQASEQASGQASDPASDQEEVGEDATVPVLHETSLGDPLAGLDVISTGTTSAYSVETGEADDEFVDLARWYEDNRTPQSTRMVAHDEAPLNNQQKDFAEMLDKFKEGVARSVDDTDFDSHYDLGIAFREMGLMDEAISAFQKATRGSSHRLRASEALGECFIERGQPAVAATILDRIVDESGLTEDALVGVLYLRGRSAEELDKPGEASAFYQRVIAVDMGFRDAARRLSSLAKARR